MDQDLLAHTRASPDDLAVRLVLADALEDRGDTARASFVREQCARRPDEPRSRLERALWQRHGRQWLREDLGADAPADRFVYHRGLPGEVRLELGRLLPLADVLARYPVHKLAIHELTRESDLESLAEHPLLETVTSLELGYGLEGMGAAAISRLLRSPRLRHLSRLALTPHQDCPDAMRALSIWPGLARLEGLSLSGVTVSSSLWAKFPRLTSLSLGWSGPSDGLRKLAQGPMTLDSLSLMVRGPSQGDPVLGELLGSPACEGLRSLSLFACNLRDASADMLRSLPCAPRLQNLNVRSQQLPDAVNALADADLPALRTLSMGHNELTDREIERFVRGRTGPLEALHADKGRITGAGASLLVERFERLHTLVLDDNPVGDLAASAIAASPCVETLRRLGLSYVGLTGEGARALLRSPQLRRLRHLNLAANSQLDLDTLREIADAPFEDMEHLNLSWIHEGSLEDLTSARWLPRPEGHENYELRLS